MMPFFSFDDDEFFGDLLLMGAASGSKAVEATATGNPLTFVTDLARPLKSLLIPFAPQQEGTGDPSPSNIRPIVPWNGLTVFGGGKNLFNETDIKYSGYILLENGSMTENQNYNVSDFVFVKAGTYSISFDNYNAPSQNTVLRICCYSEKKTNSFIAQAYSGSPLAMDQRIEATFTITSDCYILVTWRKTHTNIMLVVGSTPSAYEEYKPITETDISFPSPVYGGEHEAVSGRLMNEWAEIASYNGETIPGEWLSDRDVYSAGTTPTIGAQVVYKLATPQEITLTPEQITALVGDNTIWSDADGSMTAVYLKKG